MPRVRRRHQLPSPSFSEISLGIFWLLKQSGLLSSLFGVKNFDFSLLQTDMFVGKGGGFEVWHPGFWFWFRDLGAC